MRESLASKSVCFAKKTRENIHTNQGNLMMIAWQDRCTGKELRDRDSLKESRNQGEEIEGGFQDKIKTCMKRMI